MPYVVLFYKENDLSKEYIFYLHAIYSISIVVFEVPSGYLADRLGRKTTLLLGAILGFAGFSVYSLSYGVMGFIIAELILGLGQSFISGSDSAMLYDTTLELKKKDKYLMYEGRISASGNYAEGAAAIIASFLVFGSFRNVYYFQTLIAFTAIPAALLLIEPHRSKRTESNSFTDILKIVKHALFQNKLLRDAILLSSIIGSATLSMAWFAQIVFVEIELDKQFIAYVWAFLNLIVGIGSWSAHKIQAKLGFQITALTIILLIPVFYLLTGLLLSIYAIGILILFYIVRGVATPVLKNTINEITSSDVRATVLSIRSLIIRSVYAILAPIIGVFTNKFSLSRSLSFSGILFLILSVIVYFSFMKNHKKISDAS
jgi:MFS family permease